LVDISLKIVCRKITIAENHYKEKHRETREIKIMAAFS